MTHLIRGLPLSDLLEWIMRIQISHKRLELVCLCLERFGRLKILIRYCFCLPLLQHCKIASNHLQLVTDVLELNGQIEILISNCSVLLLSDNRKLFPQFLIILIVIQALQFQISRLQNPIVPRRLDNWRLLAPHQRRLIFAYVASFERKPDKSHLVELVVLVLMVLMKR